MPPPGTDPTTFTAPEIIINRKLEYAIEVMQFPAITCIKLSFLFFYKRIFSTPSTPILRFILWAMIAICAAWGIVYFFTFVFVCGTHVSAMWANPMIFKQHCSRIVNENYWLAITDFILDAIIFIIPIPLVSEICMVHEVFIHALKVLRQAYKSSGTNNLMVTIGMYWTIFESGMGLIVACMPAIYVLIKRFLEAHFDFRTSPSRNGYSWTWRTTARSQSERLPHASDGNTSQVEFVKLGAVGGIVDTKIGHEDKESEGENGNEGGIMVVKTVRRTEDMI
ncbi:hypothetical protein N0V90_008558 [Kalmusia sp. IMI 367209]|nr:hypothetical protein N0V90_008558 [Kalmusia sp. IMI 367209]